jgi:hypothetical protein
MIRAEPVQETEQEGQPEQKHVGEL